LEGLGRIRSSGRSRALQTSERGFSGADLEKGPGPRGNVALRANTGGLAQAETERMIKKRLERIAVGEERLAQRRGRVERGR
jgi:hypothetical protein